MIARFLLGICLLAIASCAAASPDPRIAAARASLVRLGADGFVGSALVACGDDVLLSEDIGVSPPPGRAPSYWVASITKQFTAAGILRLAEQGRLKLEDPIAAYLTGVPPDKRKITLFLLLTHQSGLPQAYAADGIIDREAAAHAILATPLASAPGEKFLYSNDNYSLLAILIEKVAGVSYENFLSHEIFAPSGLRDFGFWPETASGFAPPVLAPPGPPIDVANWGFRGGVGVRVSVPDLHRWMRILERGAMLSAASRALLFGPHLRAGDGDGVGFGWFWSRDGRGRELLWTRGTDSLGGNAILYRVVGTPLIIAAATNAGPAESAGPGWSRRVRDAMLDVFAGPAPCAHAATR